MATDYVPAEEVVSPRRMWSLITVLHDEKKPVSCVLALGKWDDEPVLAMRWNGSKENPLGTPQSRGISTWFIIGDHFNDCLIGVLPDDKKALVKTILKKT